MRHDRVRKKMVPIVVLGLGIMILLFILRYTVENASREFVVKPEAYAQLSEIEVDIVCTDDRMVPNILEVEKVSLIRFIFHNTGTAQQRFGIRIPQGSSFSAGPIDSTMVIAPQTNAGFLWRVPDNRFAAEMFCTDHAEREDEIVGELLVLGDIPVDDAHNE